MEFPEGRLLVFAKAPVPGRVKTRLISRYGPKGAADLYKAITRRTLLLLQATPLCLVELWCTPDSRHSFFATCRRDYGVRLRIQRGADLGRRMDHALRNALIDCRYAMVIGGDVPSLEVQDLRFALQALAVGQDAVLGPAEDGGYVLIGLRRPCPSLFEGIDWGGPRVLAATRRRLERAGLSWAELPLRWDVDRPAEARRLKRQFSLRSYALPLSESPNDSVT